MPWQISYIPKNWKNSINLCTILIFDLYKISVSEWHSGFLCMEAILCTQGERVPILVSVFLLPWQPTKTCEIWLCRGQRTLQELCEVWSREQLHFHAHRRQSLSPFQRFQDLNCRTCWLRGHALVNHLDRFVFQALRGVKGNRVLICTTVVSVSGKLWICQVWSNTTV